QARERVLHHRVLDARRSGVHCAGRRDLERQLRGPHSRAFQAFQGRHRQEGRARRRRLGHAARRDGPRGRAGRGRVRGHEGRPRPQDRDGRARAGAARRARGAAAGEPGLGGLVESPRPKGPLAMTAMTAKTAMTVPLLDLKAQYADLKTEIDDAVRRVMESTRFIGGPEITGLEEEIARYSQVPHAVACASGTDALLIAMWALGIGPGDEVVTSAYSFFASAGTVANNGATP